jgi:hypothetical protein
MLMRRQKRIVRYIRHYMTLCGGLLSAWEQIWSQNSQHRSVDINLHQRVTFLPVELQENMESIGGKSFYKTKS